MELPLLKTSRCLLRLPAMEDASSLVQFYKANKSHLAPWDPVMPDEFFIEDYWKKKIEEAHDEFKRNQTARFHIFLSETNTLIGMANFARMVRGVFHCCGLGYRIDQSYEGQGLMTEALQEAVRYIFEDLNFHRIEANYIPTNIRSEKLLRKLGFEKEGYAKEYLRIAGKWQDHVLNSLTNSNWRNVGV